MSKNQVQFQKGFSLPDLFKNYGTEDQCAKALFKWRWPEGFCCPQCGSKAHSVIKTRKLYQCSDCHHQTSLISGTIFEQTKLPLSRWFLAIHLIAQAKTGLSALALKRQIGVSYNTAWSMKHKIMQVMKGRDDSKPLSGTIQLDDIYWGGGRRGGKRGSGSANKVPFVAAISLNEEGHPVAMNMNVVKGFRLTEIARWASLRATARLMEDFWTSLPQKSIRHAANQSSPASSCVRLDYVLRFATYYVKATTMTLRLFGIKCLPPSRAIAHVGLAHFPSPTGD